jgi:glutaminyl-tRNA synthetase
MKEGALPPGSCALRAKIDMKSHNIKMRDPVIYTISSVRLGQTTEWVISPSYSFAQAMSCIAEGVTHNIIAAGGRFSVELYNWYCKSVGHATTTNHLNVKKLFVDGMTLDVDIMRKLIEEKKVEGWDDPRLPTLAGLRRRGIPAAAVIDYVKEIGISHNSAFLNWKPLYTTTRRMLLKSAPQRLAIMNPIPAELIGLDTLTSVKGTDFPESDENLKKRRLPVGTQILLNSHDFALDKVTLLKKLQVGGVADLWHLGLAKVLEVNKGAEGEIKDVKLKLLTPKECAANHATPKKISWVHGKYAISCEFRIYGDLFSSTCPGYYRDVLEDLKPNSKQVCMGFVERSVASAAVGSCFLFPNRGFFIVDKDTTDSRLVFSLIATV